MTTQYAMLSKLAINAHKTYKAYCGMLGKANAAKCSIMKRMAFKAINLWRSKVKQYLKEAKLHKNASLVVDKYTRRQRLVSIIKNDVFACEYINGLFSSWKQIDGITYNEIMSCKLN